jgi:hypothetical protein
MERVWIESWEQFGERAAALPARDGTIVLWRGQADPKWPLASSFERRVLALWGGDRGENGSLPPYDGHPTASERDEIGKWRSRLLELFRRALMGVSGAPVVNPDTRSLWALGPHFGLITPYLDWTRNPFFAAFFALTDARVAPGSSEVAI